MQRAAVNPRGRLGAEGETLPLERIVTALYQRGVRDTVYLLGASGSGRTTALQHLANALSPRIPLLLLDEDQPAPPGRRDALTIRATSDRAAASGAVTIQLARWNEDDLIEYLLARHPARCASVMSRLRDDPERSPLAGLPQLWAIVLDRMAADDAITDTRAALWTHLRELIPDETERLAAGKHCFRILRGSDTAGRSLAASPAASILRHPAVQVLLAGDFAADVLRRGLEPTLLISRLPRELVRTIGSRVRNDSAAIDNLSELLSAMRYAESHAMAASILLAADPAWRPRRAASLVLRHASLSGAQWAKLDLREADLRQADLSGADLRGACLYNAGAVEADFQRARLDQADLRRLRAHGADFSHASLAGASLDHAVLKEATFEGADLVKATLRDAHLSAVRLLRANLRQADLRDAKMTLAIVENADLRDADLRGARLAGVDLRPARLDGANFAHAELKDCNLEQVELADARFREARLSGSLFTGSVMPRGDFRGAKLDNTGLAEVNWERADLRGADLAGASFHLGSTRSGLVGSVIPCEGSRTGFYTDDYNEQDYRPPEEIRKANLRGADLRGASIDGVDFYLVDLRDARYTREQADHLRRCGAILGTAVSGEL